VFDHFGGHHASGGFSVAQERVHELAPKLASAYNNLRKAGATEKVIVIDRELTLPELPYAQKELVKMAPFGVGNEKPLFIFSGVTIASSRMFGKRNEHIDLGLKGANSPFSVSGVAFFSNPESFTKRADIGAKGDLVGHVENDWKGRPRIRVVDFN
jgi:single-stranded-DNA-specific exonuclease